MANIKIAQLTNKTSLADTDLLIVESATQTMKMTVGKLKELLGVQNGGIVESGSNANGSYVKYSDGTMICWASKSIDVPVSNPLPNGGYRSTGVNNTYPVAFVDTPTVFASFAGADVLTCNSYPSPINMNTVCVIMFKNLTAISTSITINYHYTAIGRWK